MPVSTLPRGTAFVRFAQALAVAKGSLPDAEGYAQQWRDTPQVAACLKAAVAVGTTDTSGWAAEIAVYQNMANEFIELLRPQTILGRIPNVATVPFLTKVPRVTAGSSAHWVGQNTPTPLSALALDTLSLAVTKLQTGVVITNELARQSTPAATSIIKRDMAATITQYGDVQFIDPTVAASAGISPASITYGATSRSSTGSSVAQITADAQAMFASAIAGGCSLQNAVWVLNPRSAAFLSSALTTGNARMWPEVSVRGGSWFGLPVLCSASVPIDTGNDTYAVLLDGGEIMVADYGIELDVSTQASVQMSSTPSGPATSSVSLWASDMTALRATRFIKYCRRRDAAVQVLKDVSW